MMLLNIILILFTSLATTGNDTDVTPKNKPANNVPSELTWEADRRLSWDDFAAKADDRDPLHALTATNLDVKANCKDNKFNYEVRSVFVVDESWSKNKQSEKLLFHEQMHFDLTEVYARKLRKKLSEMNDPCLAANQDDLGPIINGIFDEWKDAQDEYDKDCNHGLDYAKQDAWAKKIEKQLKELEDFKS